MPKICVYRCQSASRFLFDRITARQDFAKKTQCCRYSLRSEHGNEAMRAIRKILDVIAGAVRRDLPADFHAKKVDIIILPYNQIRE